LIVPVPSSLTIQGPFSPKRAKIEEHPGPPVSHTFIGGGGRRGWEEEGGGERGGL